MDYLQKQVEVEKGLDDLSFYLDGLFKVRGVGWRFGLDAVIGLIPNVGDTITFLPALYILFAGVRYGVPKITLLRMAFNLGLDYVVGMIPFFGDAFDFVWKANQQNMNLIRTRAAGHGQGKASDYVFVVGLIFILMGVLITSIVASFYVIGWLIWTITN